MAIYIADLRSTSGWTERWKTGDGLISTTVDGLRITKTGETESYGISYDAIDSDSGRDDIEILAKVRFSVQASSSTLVGVFARGDGATGSQNMVRAILFSASTSPVSDSFAISEYSGGTSSGFLDSVVHLNIVSTWYWIRMRANGTDLKGKIWTDGTTEPSAWSLEATTSIDQVGWAGVYAYDTATDPYDIGYFAVATNGDSLSTGASGGFFLGADF